MKYIFFIYIFFLISNCSFNLVDDHHGVYYLEKKQISESIKDFSFFIDIYEKNVLSGDNLEREALGLCYVDRAHAYDSIGEYEKAFNDLRRSAELDCELAKKILNNQIQK